MQGLSNEFATESTKFIFVLSVAKRYFPRIKNQLESLTRT